jgi:hypothetical protein
MATIQSPKRIIVEDFPKEDRQIAEKLGGSLNLFMDEVYRVLSKNLNTYDNLNRELRTIKATVDINGIPKNTLQFQNVLKTKISGMIVIRAFNALVNAQPFITYSENSGIVSINQIVGLKPDTEYQLLIEIIGD